MRIDGPAKKRSSPPVDLNGSHHLQGIRGHALKGFILKCDTSGSSGSEF